MKTISLNYGMFHNPIYGSNFLVEIDTEIEQCYCNNRRYIGIKKFDLLLALPADLENSKRDCAIGRETSCWKPNSDF